MPDRGGAGRRGNYATLLVNVVPNGVPAWLSLDAATARQRLWGVVPPAGPASYSAWSINADGGSYTVMDLTQFPAFADWLQAAAVGSSRAAKAAQAGEHRRRGGRRLVGSVVPRVWLIINGLYYPY